MLSVIKAQLYLSYLTYRQFKQNYENSLKMLQSAEAVDYQEVQLFMSLKTLCSGIIIFRNFRRH